VRPATCEVFGHKLTVDLFDGRCLRCGLVQARGVEVIPGSETTTAQSCATNKETAA
jgi:hypothetical protein